MAGLNSDQMGSLIEMAKNRGSTENDVSGALAVHGWTHSVMTQNQLPRSLPVTPASSIL